MHSNGTLPLDARCVSSFKVHSHERQHLRVHVHLRLRQNDNIVSMGMLRQMQRMGVEPILYV